MKPNQVECVLCGRVYDYRDPSVRYWYGDAAWACDDETECFARIGAQPREEQT